MVTGDLAGVKVQQVTSYGDCSLAVSADGHLFGWGNSEYLQLASVTESTQVRPDPSASYVGLCEEDAKDKQTALDLSAAFVCWLFIPTDKLSKAATSPGGRQSATGGMWWDAGGRTQW